MPKYVIERNIPGAGKMSEADLKAVSQKSCGVLRKLGSEIQWLQSYVTDDKIYCVYIAPNEAMVREHAKQGGVSCKLGCRCAQSDRSNDGRVACRRSNESPNPVLLPTRRSKKAGAGGIGSMRQGIRCWKGYRRKHEREGKSCGLIRSRCRRGSGGSWAGEWRVASSTSPLSHTTLSLSFVRTLIARRRVPYTGLRLLSKLRLCWPQF